MLKRIKYLNICLFVLLSLTLLPIMSKTCSAEAKEVKKVLIVNSYHKEFTWTDDVTEGIVEKLQSHPSKIDISIEYLDWKNHPSTENINNFYRNIKYKYTSQNIDLVITSDDAATNFVLQYRKDLFPDTPIVFCGLYKEAAWQVYRNYSNITGVIENIDILGTIRAALKLNPEAQTIYVIHEQTESGIQSLENVRQAATAINKKLKVEALDSISFNDPTSFPTDLSPKSVVILTSFFRDRNGETEDIENIASLLSKKIAMPIFHVYEMGVGSGLIGGSLLSGKIHGIKTAEIGLKILKGESASSIAPYHSHDSILTFDYKLLKKFGIPLSHLPEGSRLINSPTSFYQTYKSLVLIVLAVFIIMVTFILILLFNIYKRKKAENLLKNSYDQQNSLYEELAATEEELRNHYELLEKSEDKYHKIFEVTNNSLIIFNSRGIIVDVNKAACKLYGYPKEEFIGRMARDIIMEDFRKTENIEKYWQGLKEKGFFYLETTGRTKDGQLLNIEIDSSDFDIDQKFYLAALRDITERKEAEIQLKQMAYFDKVTKLPNRTSFYEWLDNKLKQRDSSGGAIFFIDLDNFKIINDTFGHLYGDRLLKEVAKKLNSLQNENILIARLGGDEFIIAIDSLSESSKIISYAKSILNIFKDSFFLDENELPITASIGIALYPVDGITVDELLKKADSAMYKAKEFGKNKFMLFDQSMEEELYTKIMLSNKIKSAIGNEEMTVFYQPLLEVSSNQVYGFEVLIRWTSPDYGFVPPLKFINLAEETGQIISLGEWVLRQACNFALEVNKNREDKLIVSVNISSVQLMQNDFVNSVQQILEEIGLTPHLLGLEITESILMDSFASNARKLEQLKKLGIKVALDDFGTGYSSLNYLRHLPISMLKIDKTFIDDIIKDEKVNYLTKSLVEIAHNMGFGVVAEGVETENQLKLLKDHNCDLVQGYLISKPMPKEDVLKFLEDQ